MVGVTNRLADLVPLISQVETALVRIKAGEVVEVCA